MVSKVLKQHTVVAALERLLDRRPPKRVAWRAVILKPLMTHPLTTDSRVVLKTIPLSSSTFFSTPDLAGRI